MAKYSVLIVEDVPEMAEMIRELIAEMVDFEVSGVAHNLWEARLELDRRRPHLVLLDEVLPGESSSDLVKELRERDLPVILMTSLENPQHSLPEGVGARIQKPDWKELSRVREQWASFFQAALKN